MGSDNQDQERVKDIRRLKMHEKYFYIFFILSVLSLIDVGTRSMVFERYGLSDVGYISGYLPGSAIISIIFSFSLLWIGISIVEYFTVKKLRRAINSTSK